MNRLQLFDADEVIVLDYQVGIGRIPSEDGGQLTLIAASVEVALHERAAQRVKAHCERRAHAQPPQALSECRVLRVYPRLRA